MSFLDVKVVEINNVIYLQKNEFKVESHPEVSRILRGKKYLEKTIIIGMRAEDVLVNVNAGNASFTANVDAIENMGSEKYLYFTAGAENITGKVGQESNAKLGDDFRISFRTSKIHYFDQDNRQRIKHVDNRQFFYGKMK